MALSQVKEDFIAIRSLLSPGQVIEVRALDVSTPTRRTPHTVSGYFDDFELLAKEVAKLSPHAKGVYFTPNPVNPALLARAANRVQAVGREPLTSDIDILVYRWLLIDADPVRPAGISSTDTEHQAALMRIQEIRLHLLTQGWPEPLVADSGNGGHLLYRIDLPVGESGLVERCLKALAFQFNDAVVTVDQKVFNPARIWKFYGTWSRKGDTTPSRPHRQSAFIEAPDVLATVPRKLLDSLAASIPQSPKPQDPRAGKRLEDFDLEAWIATHGLKLLGPTPWGDGQRWIFRVCPWNESHTNRSAYLLRFGNGAIAAGCHHNGCIGKGWADLKAIYPIPRQKWEDVPHSYTKVTLNNLPKPAPNKDGDTSAACDSLFSFLPDPPRFPVEVFPPRYQRVLAQIASAYASPIEIPAVTLLTVAGACIGGTRAIRIKRSWVEHPNLFMAIIGRSGIGKSPPIKKILSPIFRQEKAWYDEYRDAKDKYLDELKNTKKGEPQPIPPQWMQLIVDDTTIEALTDALCCSDRGILWNRDELSGLILDLDKYSGKEGGTKARLMSSYDCGPWKINRIGKDRCGFIPHAILSIFGTIQPKAMATIFSDRDISTGFLPRFIFVRAEREAPPFWTDEEVGPETDEALKQMVEIFLSYQASEKGAPEIISLSPAAKVKYVKWYNSQVHEAWIELDTTLYESVLAKIRGQALRIALILHCLESTVTGEDELSQINAETMEKALLLMDCFKEHQRQAWSFVSEKGIELSPIQRRVVRAIVNLKDKIESGCLASSLVAEVINQGMEENFCLSTDKVGRVLSSLGLESVHRRAFRGFSITPEVLDKYENMLGIESLVSPVARTNNGAGL